MYLCFLVSKGKNLSPFPQPPIFFLIFTFIQMGLLCFFQTVRETKNNSELSEGEERVGKGERQNMPKAGWSLCVDNFIKCMQNTDISRLWQIRQGDYFQPTSGNNQKHGHKFCE